MTSPVYKFFTAPEEVQRPIVEEAIRKASKEQLNEALDPHTY